MWKNVNLQNIVLLDWFVVFLLLSKWKTHFTSHSILSWVRYVDNSTREIDNFVLVDNNHWFREIFAPWAKKAQRILISGRIVGADEPSQAGVIFINFLSFFQCGKNTMIGRKNPGSTIEFVESLARWMYLHASLRQFYFAIFIVQC